MMFKIAICDDDVMVCNQIEEIINVYLEENNNKIEVDIFYSAVSLTEKIIEMGAYDLIFLDIGMDELNGIEFGMRLREMKHDELVKIVFISHKDSYAMELFRIRPMDFLKKPLSAEDIVYNIEKSMELLGEQRSFFLYKLKYSTNNIPINEILYFESANRMIIMHTSSGEIKFYEKLQEIEERLDGKYFWRIHQSYIINVMHSKTFEHKEVTMDSGKVLPISSSYRADMKKYQRALMGKGS